MKKRKKQMKVINWLNQRIPLIDYIFNILEDEQPLIEALAAIGIKVDSLMYVKTDNQRIWMCPVKECRKPYTKQSALKVHILSHYGLRPFKVMIYEVYFETF
jgi:hypothetical protein